MTSYFTNIIECSECKKDFTFRGLSSCNTFDAYFFTDGSIMGPMYDTQPDLIECPHCELISWIDELNVIDRMQDHNFFTTDDQSLPPYSHRVHYCEAVAKSLWRNPAEEKEIRIKAWQEFNKMKTRCDPLSIHELDSSIKHGYNNENNLTALMCLLDENHNEELLLKAEVCRHLKLFGQATKLLEGKKVSTNLQDWKRTIQYLIRDQSNIDRMIITKILPE